MPGVQYHHIGHNPRFGEIALWAMDERGTVHEDRRIYDAPDQSWLDWSHQNTFREIKPIASGRVELAARAGSIHIPDPALFLDNRRLIRILDRLDAAYPRTRWYVFGDGLNGVSVMTALAHRVASSAGAGAPNVARD